MLPVPADCHKTAFLLVFSSKCEEITSSRVEVELRLANFSVGMGIVPLDFYLPPSGYNLQFALFNLQFSMTLPPQGLAFRHSPLLHHLTTSPPDHLITSPPHHLTTSPPHHPLFSAVTTSPKPL